MRALGLRGLLFTALIISSCNLDVPDGIFSCSDDRGCPEGWSCRLDGFCYPTADPDNTPISEYPDAGDPPAPMSDASATPPSDASAPSDAEPPTEPTDAGDDAGGAEPDVDGPCDTSGAKACRGHASFDKLVCQGGRWLIIGVCEGTVPPARTSTIARTAHAPRGHA